MTEIYYNSGRYQNSLAFLIPLFPTPFDFYLEMHSYSVKVGVNSLSSSKHLPYDLLMRFASENNIDCETLKWLLLFDMLLHERLRSVPSWLECFSDYENKARKMNFLTKNPNIRDILPGYSDNELKQLTKLVSIQTFPLNPKTLEFGEYSYLFDYKQRDLDGHAKAILITL